VVKFLLIGVGGALGSMVRYWLGSTIANRYGTRFPWGTFLINLLACTAIGFSLTFLAKHVNISPAWRFLVPVGFIGAFSTFSTYEWETLSSIQDGAFLFAAIYASSSFVLGLIAVWGGATLATALLG
jgi:CrcB protein